MGGRARIFLELGCAYIELYSSGSSSRRSTMSATTCAAATALTCAVLCAPSRCHHVCHLPSEGAAPVAPRLSCTHGSCPAVSAAAQCRVSTIECRACTCRPRPRPRAETRVTRVSLRSVASSMRTCAHTRRSSGHSSGADASSDVTASKVEMTPAPRRVAQPSVAPQATRLLLPILALGQAP